VYGEEDATGGQWAEGILHVVKHQGYEAFWEKLWAWRNRLRNPGKRKAADQLLHYAIRTHDVQLGNSGFGAQVLYPQAPTSRFAVKNEDCDWLTTH
jgi:hypothetical protein